MFLELEIDNEVVTVPFKVQSKEDLEDNTHCRLWSFISDDNDVLKGIVGVNFIEEAYILKEVTMKPSNLVTSDNTLAEIINELLKEELENAQEGIDDSEEGEEGEIQPYDPKKINIRNDRWSISHMFELINKWDEVDLSPDFQRNFVWDKKRRSQLIESLMLGIPVPAFYLSETLEGRYQVVDGVQRLTTIRDFLDNKFSLRGLEYLKEQEKKFFKEEGKKKGIDREFVRRIQLTQINVNIIEAKSPNKVKFDVFRRVNTGGKPLNSQEIRNCLAEKRVRALINDLAKSKEFIQATDGSVRTTRMQAQELVLRFIAFYQSQIVKSPEWNYTGNMRTFLDESIDLLNQDKSVSFDKLTTVFLESMKICQHLFGEYCFRKCLPDDLEEGARRQLINKSLFTTWSVILAQFQLEKVLPLVEHRDFAHILAKKLANHGQFYEWVSFNTNDKTSLEGAFKMTRELVKEHLKL